MQDPFRRGCADTDTCIRRCEVDAVNAAENERIALRNRCLRAKGRGIGQIVNDDICAVADDGVLRAGRVCIARVLAEEGIISARRVARSGK